jgi:FtsH-binding integral membrane protein
MRKLLAFLACQLVCCMSISAWPLHSDRTWRDVAAHGTELYAATVAVLAAMYVVSRIVP